MHIESEGDGDELEGRFRIGDADALRALLEQREELSKDVLDEASEPQR